jgi:hypothetical protein
MAGGSSREQGGELVREGLGRLRTSDVGEVLETARRACFEVRRAYFYFYADADREGVDGSVTA